MPVPVAEAVSALVEEFTQQLLALLPAAAAAELDALTFQAGSIPGRQPSAARPPGKKAQGARSGPSKAAGSGRRSSPEASQTLEAIATLLREKPGLGGEEIRRTLRRPRGEIRGALALGLWTDVLRNEGEERAATYFVGPAGGKADARASDGGH
ncbi:MAG: hypothetical protein JWM10_135 [Myxococcaceae bacterium]|nr:hypothetical protein [Myxococcaceae bacterium]